MFLTGVVEGFYGVPWTPEQRKKLFKRMQNLGMNTYVYAPKDDAKHRVYWREPYSVEESEHLTSLIEGATSCGIQFVYALSPGLDVVYSNSKEISLLKRKLQQVAGFGCKAFALLFDDIDTDMCPADKQSFQSIAQAQVAISNEVYEHLGMPPFLFCPTEYCASRADPSIQASEYLNTIGARLLSGIDVLWTGPNVVSKLITIQSIDEITKVLRRPPVIWDNLHANDYDAKRLFLGPYDGRSPELIPNLHGVLTNPNCEFEANFVALHTLAQWCRCEVDGLRPDHPLVDSPEVACDIKLEREGDVTAPSSLPVLCSYSPRKALEEAVRDWLVLIHDDCPFVSKKMALASPPSIVPPQVATHPHASSPTSPSLAPTGVGVDPFTPTLVGAGVTEVGVTSTAAEGQIRPEASITFLPAATQLPVNSLAEPQPSTSSSDDEVDSGTESSEPMDLVGGGLVTGGPPPAGPSLLLPPPLLLPRGPVDDDARAGGGSDVELGSAEDSVISDNDVMQVDVALDMERQQESSSLPPPSPEADEDRPALAAVLVMPILSEMDVTLLAEFFYLPFEHGSRAVELLNDIVWLRSNVDLLVGGGGPSGRRLRSRRTPAHRLEDQKEWYARAQKLQGTVMQVYALFDRLCAVPNKALLMDLFPYIWDMKATLSVLSSFIEWLAQCPVTVNCEDDSCLAAPYNWTSATYRGYFASGQSEPWLYRGGLQGEIQRLLPVDSVLDLFYPVFPSIPNTRLMMSVHPYVDKYQEKVYEICSSTYDSGMDGTDPFPDHTDIIGDKTVGPFLAFSPEFCFVIKDDVGICGYVVAALDVRDFFRRVQSDWLPSMRDKYSALLQSQDSDQGMTSHWQAYDQRVSDDVYMSHPSIVHVDMLPSRGLDPSAPRRALACAVAALKTSRSRGVYTQLNSSDRNVVDFYARLGFLDVNNSGSPTSSTASSSSQSTVSDDVTIMGRLL